MRRGTHPYRDQLLDAFTDDVARGGESGPVPGEGSSIAKIIQRLDVAPGASAAEIFEQGQGRTRPAARRAIQVRWIAAAVALVVLILGGVLLHAKWSSPVDDAGPDVAVPSVEPSVAVADEPVVGEEPTELISPADQVVAVPVREPPQVNLHLTLTPQMSVEELEQASEEAATRVERCRSQPESCLDEAGRQALALAFLVHATHALVIQGVADRQSAANARFLDLELAARWGSGLPPDDGTPPEAWVRDLVAIDRDDGDHSEPDGGNARIEDQADQAHVCIKVFAGGAYYYQGYFSHGGSVGIHLHRNVLIDLQFQGWSATAIINSERISVTLLPLSIGASIKHMRGVVRPFVGGGALFILRPIYPFYPEGSAQIVPGFLIRGGVDFKITDQFGVFAGVQAGVAHDRQIKVVDPRIPETAFFINRQRWWANARHRW